MSGEGINETTVLGCLYIVAMLAAAVFVSVAAGIALGAQYGFACAAVFGVLAALRVRRSAKMMLKRERGGE